LERGAAAFPALELHQGLTSGTNLMPGWEACSRHPLRRRRGYAELQCEVLAVPEVAPVIVEVYRGSRESGRSS
jgi:hypothetical protein